MKKFYFTLFLFATLLVGTVYSQNHLFAQEPSSKSEQSKDYQSSYIDIFNKMKEGMNAAQNTGNVNLDFVLEMIPHHEGGINMAKAIIKYGTNEDVKKIAQNIVTSQEAQIPLMQQLKAKFEKEPLSTKEDSQNYIKDYDEIKSTMFKEMESVPLTGSSDETFLRQMIYHHEGAIAMSKNILKYTKNAKLKALAENIVTTQSQGVDEMKNLLETMK
ncbi:Uncharacterized protein conserved in bacteria [[Clostridium] sordellii]|uniref:DUF305 domain-containing protein n=1 Tax=Paraclostridium sordellii TaxID=1505 RepID=UPI0005E1EE16|nr:DUF305 domain-containing protein [Paeniclostridium sordellii]CEQ08930.1 Uncharacterized protein conserved in bacteria [[Clostridium] sordellii] [Paeniclostridium sordellii]